MERERKDKKTGFTIVELLTVMGIIAILIGLLVPALTLVRDYAKEIQQIAQFHSIEVGVSMIHDPITGLGMYPPSNENTLAAATPPLAVDSSYGGAQKLGEAMVGLDMLGYHPRSGFRADGQNTRDDGSGAGTLQPYPFTVYHSQNDDPGNAMNLFAETALENVQNRKYYMELENANAFTLDSVYDTSELTTAAFSADYNGMYSVVLCDVYTQKRLQSGKKTGMPVLYYKARTGYTRQEYDDVLGIADDVYNYEDNQALLNLGSATSAVLPHPLADGIGNDLEDFENMILNPEVAMINKPYRAESYLLISAGKDGLYGTSDDICNFKKN